MINQLDFTGLLLTSVDFRLVWLNRQFFLFLCLHVNITSANNDQNNNININILFSGLVILGFAKQANSGYVGQCDGIWVWLMTEQPIC